MLHIFYTRASFITLLIVSSLCHADSVMQQGAWKMQATMFVQNSKTEPYKEVMNSHMTYCLSQAFLDKNPYLTASIDQEKMKAKNAKCSISDEKHDENKASWTMTCELPNAKTIATIQNSIAEQQMSSLMQQTIWKDGIELKTKMETKGDFAGECTKDMLTL
jgi:hypothetical protein